jgi:hypothetical protein
MGRAMSAVKVRGRGAWVRGVDGVEVVDCFPQLEMEVTMFRWEQERHPQVDTRDSATITHASRSRLQH